MLASMGSLIDCGLPLLQALLDTRADEGLTDVFNAHALTVSATVTTAPGGEPDFGVELAPPGPAEGVGEGGWSEDARALGFAWEEQSGFDGAVSMRMLEFLIRVAFICADPPSHPTEYTWESRGGLGAMALWQEYRRGRRARGWGCVLRHATRREAEVLVARFRYWGFHARVCAPPAALEREQTHPTEGAQCRLFPMPPAELGELEKRVLEAWDTWCRMEGRRSEVAHGPRIPLLEALAASDTFPQCVSCEARAREAERVCGGVG